MKPFLRKILSYIIIPIILCHVLFVIIYFIISVQVDKKLKTIADNYSVLIMGDSQMQKIAPDLFTPETYSLAAIAEHYFFTYSKLRKLVANKDHKIRCIVLGVSVHNFSALFENGLSLETSEGKAGFRKYLFSFDLFNNDFFRPEEIILNKDFFLGVLSGPELGGHDVFYNKNPAIPFIESRLKFVFGGSLANPENPLNQEYYLDKIVDLCSKEKITMVMVSNPVHPYFKSRIDSIYFDALNKVVNKHANLPYLNFLKDSVPTIYMSDANHLNKEGAELYSKKINTALKSYFDQLVLK